MINILKYKYYRFKWWLVGKFKLTTRFPIHVDIETASECNLKCVMCPHGDTAWPFENKGIMPREVAIRAINQTVKGGAKSIKFNFRGEPGLNRNLEGFVKLAKLGGITEVFMNTNALAFSPSRIYKLKEAGLDKAIISIDGATESTYKKIRVGGDFEKLIQNLRIFKRAGHNLRLQMTVLGSNVHEVESFKRLFAPYGEVVTRPARHIGTERAVCPQPWRRLVVAHDEKVFGCCNSWRDEFPVGDFKTQTLKQIWEGDKIKELRQHAIAGTGPCLNCEVNEAWKN